MTRIDRLSSILEVIRRRTERADTGRTEGRRTRGANSGQSRVPLPALEDAIHGRLIKLDLSLPEDAKQARRVFLESVLTWEFGATVPTDPRFHSIVSRVQDAFEADAELSDQLDRLVADLQHRRR